MKSLFKLNSVRSKLVLMSLFLLIFPLITLGTVSFFTAKNTLGEQGELRLETSIEMTLEMIEVLNEQVEAGNLSLEEAQERVKVAILGEKDETGKRPINENIDLGKYGYILITDENGVALAHPEEEGVSLWEEEDRNGEKFIQHMIDVAQEDGGFTNYDWPLPTNENKTEEKVAFSKLDPNWGWVVHASAYMQDFNAPAYTILKVIYTVAILAIAIGVIVSLFYAKRLVNPLNKVIEQMQEIAKGNLNLQALQIGSKDETGQLAETLNEMQSSLHSIVENVHRAADNISSQSEQLTQAAYEVSEGGNQISSTMQELASGAESQANRSSDISSMMGSFVKQIEEMNGHGEEIQESSSQIVDLTEEGRKLMGTSTMQMKKIDQIVHEAVEKVEGLDQHSQNISELVLMIQDIAEQTNLLALNAAIEAARAGEHGQGFAVVADEVRKLAEESSNSVVHITEIVNQIQEESSSVANSLRSGYEEVEQGTEHIVTTEETLTEIDHSISAMVERINEIVDNLESIVANSLEMNNHIEDIAAISEESAAGIEETTATTEQSNSTMDEVAKSSKELSNLADELNKLVEQFNV